MSKNSTVAWVFVPNIIDGLRISLFVVEMALNVTVLLLASCFAMVLYKTQTLHVNLKVSFFNIVLNAFMIAITRYLIICDMLADNKFLGTESTIYIILACMHDSGIGMDTTNQLGLVVERTVATLRTRDYERSRSVFLAVCIFAFPWCPAVIHGVFIHLSLMNTYSASIMLGSINIFSWMCFLCLRINNNVSFDRKRNVSLTERYQITENIRTVRTINLFVITVAVRNAICISLAILWDLLLVPQKHYYAYRIATNFYDLTVTVYQLAAPLVVMLSHQEMSKHFGQLICRSRHVPSSTRLNGLNGRQLIIEVKPEDHFKELQSAWK